MMMHCQSTPLLKSYDVDSPGSSFEKYVSNQWQHQGNQEMKWKPNGSFSQINEPDNIERLDNKVGQQNISRCYSMHKHTPNQDNSFIASQNLSGNGKGKQKTTYIGYQLPVIMCKKGRGPKQHNRQLTMVCVDPNCLDSDQFLLCSICSEQEHVSHEQVPIKLLVQDVLSCIGEDEDQPKKFEMKLTSQRIETLNKLADLRQLVSERLDQLEQDISYTYEVLGTCQVKRATDSSRKDVLNSIDCLMSCSNEEQLRIEIQNIMTGAHAVCEGNPNEDKTACITQDIDLRHEKLQGIIFGLTKSIDEVLLQNIKQLNNLTFQCKEIFEGAAVGILDHHSVIAENQELRKDTIYNPDYSTTQQSPFQITGVTFSKPKGKESSPARSIYNNEKQRNKDPNTQASFISARSTMTDPNLQISLVQRFEFSKTLREPNIQIQKRTIINGMYGQTNNKLHYRVQVLQPDLEQVTPNIKQWSFKITRQLPHWIGFGMCHINEMKQRNFKFNNDEFSFSHQEGQKRNNDHGCYLITTHGWAFAHQKQPLRSPFKFTKNDVITCRYDPFKNYIIFYKNSDFKYPFNLEFNSICWNKLHPCVVLWYPDDSIELL